jgi:hypothetical protein
MIFGYLPDIRLEDTLFTRIMVWFYTQMFHILKPKNNQSFNRMFCFYKLNSILYGDDILTPEYVAKEKVQRILYTFKHNLGAADIIWNLLPLEIKLHMPLCVKDWLTHRAFRRIDLDYKRKEVT